MKLLNGEGIINQYSLKLTNELGKGYTVSNLKRFRQFYLLVIKGAPLAHQLSWSQYQEIIVLKDYNEFLYYIDIYINNVGKMLSEAGRHYGEGIIKEYSKKLKNELGKNYSVRLLYRILKYYNFITTAKLPTLSAKLSWSHYDEILRFDDINKIKYYIKRTEEQNLSVRQLRQRIKSNEYERLDESTKNKLITKEEVNVVDFVKNPIMIRNSYNYEDISEKVLKKLILEDISSFMKELGKGHTETNLKYFRQFYIFSKSHTVCDKLTYTHYCEYNRHNDVSFID